MESILVLAFLATPFFLSWKICNDRNRNVIKGLFVTLFFGWVATICFWLGLKTRRSDGTLS